MVTAFPKPFAAPASTAARLARGVTRALHDRGQASLTEFTLRSGRRVDAIGLDPGGRLTIVDFKTDRLDDEQAIAERAAAYHAQEQVYARAVHLAFGLDQPPATELWFLWPDRLWTSS